MGKGKKNLKKKTNDLNRHYPKKIYKWPKSTWKDAQPDQSLGKCKLNP